MGWTVLSKTPDRGWLAYLDSIFAGSGANKVAGSAIGADGNYYAAIEQPAGSLPRKVRGVVVLIEGAAYKIMGEEEGPFYYAAPPEVLAKLTATSNPYALKWRALCAGDPLAAVIKAGELPGVGA